MIPAGFLVTLAGALIVGFTIADGADEAGAPDSETVPPPPVATTPVPIAVDSTSIYQFETLEEMVAASDAIVVGTVVSTEPGRLVGDPQNGGVISRIVTLRVDEIVLDARPPTGAPPASTGSTVIVEEEATLADGTPIIVDGVAASEIGDAGIWFLDSILDTDIPAYLVINSQGRYLADGARLRGGDQRDPLVKMLQSLSLDELVLRTRNALVDLSEPSTS